PIQAQAKTRLSAGARRRTKFDARAHARSLRRPRLVVIQGAILSPRFVEGALKRIASGVGRHRAVSTNVSACRGAPLAGQPRGRRGSAVCAVGDDAVSSLGLGLIQALVDPLQEAVA